MKNSRKPNVKSNTSDIEAKEKKEQQEQEKILAAKRAGITDIILSKENKKDILEIKPLYLNGLTFHYVSTIKDVLDLALTNEIVTE